MVRIRLDDPYAFRPHERPAVQAVAAAVDPPKPVPGLDAESLATLIGIPLGPLEKAGEAPLLESLVGVSRDRLTEITGYEPVARLYRFRWDMPPGPRDYAYQSGGIGAYGSPARTPWFDLPRHPLIEVEQTTVDGEPASVRDVDTHSTPPRVSLEYVPEGLTAGSMGRFEIEAYVGEYDPDPENGDNDEPDLPANVKAFRTAALYMAAYLYENRGCEIGRAATDSGALNVVRHLRQWKRVL